MSDQIVFGPAGDFVGLYDVVITYKSGKVHRHEGVEIFYLREYRTYRLKSKEKNFVIQPYSWSRIEYYPHEG